MAVYYGWRDSRNKPEESIKYGDNTPIDVKFIFLFKLFILFFIEKNTKHFQMLKKKLNLTN